MPRRASGSSSPKNSLNKRSRRLIAAFGALVYALFGLRVFLSSISTLVVSARYPSPSGAGGMGLIAVDVIVLPFALLAVASVIANRMLSAWARGADGTAKAMHRTQRWSVVLAFVVSIASVAGANVGGGTALLLIPFSGLVWGASFVLTAVLLGAYVLRSS